MRHKLYLAVTALLLAALACRQGATTPEAATPEPGTTSENSVFDEDRTLHGFFPAPPDSTYKSVLATVQGIGQHGDVLLVQRNIPWNDFRDSPDADSQDIVDIHNLMILAGRNDLEAIFVVDPLNGLNRREFYDLPSGWEASFANPDVRAAFTNYTMRIVREFHPRYLGLASEINTYHDFHPDDFPNYLSLYREVYAKVKEEAPETQIFVTFQWEELNNLFDGMMPGMGTEKAYQVNWDQVEIFEPQLDLWVISSYPFVVYRSGAEIPADYYAPLLARTDKPLAVAEGGFTAKQVGPFTGTPEDQVAYLNAIHDQIGGDRLVFWIYLLLSDFNLDAYAQAMREQGRDTDIDTLGMFASVGLRESDGTPKPALEVWDSFQKDPE